MHLGFFSLAVRKCIEDSNVSGVGFILDHSLRIRSLMVEEWRLQELEAAGRMAPATRRQGAMSAAAATAAATTAAAATAAAESILYLHCPGSQPGKGACCSRCGSSYTK